MSTLKRNIVANLAGSGWITLTSLVFIPLYIHFLGIEAYGLIGFSVVLQSISTAADLGLSATLQREMARLSAVADGAPEMRNTARTLEIAYWAISVLAGAALVLLAPVIAQHWFNASHLSAETVTRAIELMGGVTACRWPFTFYCSGLVGLQRQALLNAVKASLETVRGGGAVLVLWLVSPTIDTFFRWQVAISLVSAAVAGVCLWHSIPGPLRDAHFDRALGRKLWRFAAGMSGISALATVLTQLDKIILSRLLPLETFGYYALAWTVALGLSQVVLPIFSALYPRLTQLVTLNRTEELVRLYHRGSQLMAALIVPAAIVLVLFSREILLLWTRNPSVAEHAHAVVSLLVIGTALNGLASVPYALQLAHGWTRLGFYSNAVAVVALVPLIVVLANAYGGVGGASVWVLLNSGYVLITVQLMHTQLLKTEKLRWFVQDCGGPLAASLVIALAGREWVSDSMSPIAMTIGLGAVFLMATGAGFLATPLARGWIGEMSARARTATQ